MATEDRVAKAHSNDCRHTTKYRIVQTRVQKDRDDEQDFWWQTTFDMLECCGCGDIMLRREFEFSENQESSVSFHPPRAARWLPKWQYSLPSANPRSVRGGIHGPQADSRTLAMIGARTVIEHSMISKVGDNGTFENSLQALEDGGYVSKTNRKYLKVALDAGSAAAHRAHFPKTEELETVMDIVENLLNSLFVLENQVPPLKLLPRDVRQKRVERDRNGQPKSGSRSPGCGVWAAGWTD
jgi:hypothetical protein